MRTINRNEKLDEVGKLIDEAMETVIYRIERELPELDIHADGEWLWAGIWEPRKKRFFGVDHHATSLFQIGYDLDIDEIVVRCYDKRVRKIVEETIEKLGEHNFDKYIYWGDED